ncbi:MAG: patatin-like phospholipase family protein [Candidatus Eremiobacteraeota bacterium]|nr:patatin-like phospholipase family protein [Candidatus Eremiobacteraeota bacterium]MCW5871238.1 patatin-like phospholipase family protein [Candidatus Eremiobacteraeota bacterium]
MKTCDLVMKGGIASGIVYPEAVVELSKEFAFQGIGGTSAGAIAAAATAAAEYRRREPAGGGSDLEPLLEISRYLAGRGNLKRLFQPAPGILSWAFNGLLLSQRLKLPRWLFLLMGAGYLLGMSYLAQHYGWLCPLTVLAVVGLPLGLGYLLVNQLLSKFRANRYGFCKGCGSPEQFTPWLYSMTQKLAGLGESEPLTFGHLRNRGIRFRLVTTNLNHGRPYQFPNSRATLYYRSEEMLEYFPKAVVDFMDKDNPVTPHGFRKLPVKDRLPILVPTRISSSFPGLFCAVPLYAEPFDRTLDGEMRPAGEGTPIERDELQPELCLFADGGICSNLPLHFFDSPLPEQPTFAINLDSFAPGFKPSLDESKNVRRAETNNQFSSYECWNRFSNLGGWLYSIFNAAQNWRDNGLVRKPGYRDRVVHITLAGDEGGLNLQMAPELIKRLQERGKAAGQALLKGFGASPTVKTTWDNHRWIRYRNTMKLMAEMLPKVRERLADPGYSGLFSVDGGQPPSYRFHYDEDNNPVPAEVSARRVAALKESTEKFCLLLKDWQPAEAFSISPPHPEIQLGINPELETEPK